MGMFNMNYNRRWLDLPGTEQDERIIINLDKIIAFGNMRHNDQRSWVECSGGDSTYLIDLPMHELLKLIELEEPEPRVRKRWD